MKTFDSAYIRCATRRTASRILKGAKILKEHSPISGEKGLTNRYLNPPSVKYPVDIPIAVNEYVRECTKYGDVVLVVRRFGRFVGRVCHVQLLSTLRHDATSHESAPIRVVPEPRWRAVGVQAGERRPEGLRPVLRYVLFSPLSAIIAIILRVVALKAVSGGMVETRRAHV